MLFRRRQREGESDLEAGAMDGLDHVGGAEHADAGSVESETIESETIESDVIESGQAVSGQAVSGLDESEPSDAELVDESHFDDGEGDDDGVDDLAGERRGLRLRRRRLGRTRSLFRGPLGALRARGRIDEQTLEELEEALILADAGVPTTRALLDGIRERLRTRELDGDPAAVVEDLERSIVELFGDGDRTLHRAAEGTTVWLFVGVNGVGKTTTIGKLASREIAGGAKVVLAAGDTFRAAAGEQLSLWAARSGADIVQGADGADPSSVVFDAIQHAHARGADLVLADSAGRLHTKTNLMEELKKVRRIADRDPGHVAEVLLVLDATTGQNGLAQAREFAQAVGVTGIVLTKLDGTAKGGIVLAIGHELGLPIKLVGLGEGVDDLVEFDPAEFAAALFEDQEA